jgi:hypothetical protein
MSNSDKPLAVPLSEVLGPLPEEALRQQAFVILSRLQSGTENVVRLDAALAAVAAERERWVTACCAAYADAMGRSGRERTAAADAVMSSRRACGA